MADLQKRLEKAEKYLQKGKQKDALEEYLEILEEDPNNDSVRQTAADLCISLNQTEQAIELLAVSYDRLAQIGDVGKAAITYKKLARLTTPTVEQMARYAQLIEKKDKREALDTYHQAVEGFLGKGRKADAFKALQRVVLLEPSLTNYQRQGEIASELGDGKTAATAFLQAGNLVQQEGKDPRECYERANALDGSNADAALALGRTLLAQKQSDRAVTVLSPFATGPEPRIDICETYGRTLLAARRPLDAEPYIWALYERDSKQADEVARLIGAMLDTEHGDKALAAAHRLEEHEVKRNRRREFVALLKDLVVDKHPVGFEFLEYMVEMYNSTNREHDYSDALLKLFELYFAAGNFLKAADSLDRAAEVDPYEPGHHKRMEMLRGKIETSRFNAIAGRLKIAGGVDEQQEEKPVEEKEPTVLEDFMLQAEIFLQYSMRSKALERIERIAKLFPREEEKNEKLHLLYANAGFVPKYADTPPVPQVTGSIPVPVVTGSIPAPSAAAAQAMANESAVDNISRVTEITRNIYRQGNVKSVLFTCVNDVGRHWSASRCVAGLCTPGKPPSAALEYCSTSVKQSEVMALVKLINTLQGKLVTDGVVAIGNTRSTNDPASAYIASLGIQSVLAVPLMDGDEHVGILILEQCDRPREWRQTDIVVLKTIADQTQQAVQNAKLRSLMKTLAVTDEKSGLLKRSSYLDVMLSETRRALQQNSTCTVMLLHFGKPAAMVKEVGETAVENLMQTIGQSVCSHIRQNDVAVHYELTTIAVVLADTSEKNAFFVVDKLRKVMNGTKLPGTNREVVMTVGIAEAVVQQKFDPIDIVTEVINRADTALEVAKTEGGGKAQSLAPQYETAAAAAS
ncbi:MAG: tetratricopeptide repeat protein [Acidobacteriia bacterium]|nr:tetratricopeptide repeat protein [Terriglobia bacterium]